MPCRYWLGEGTYLGVNLKLSGGKLQDRLKSGPRTDQKYELSQGLIKGFCYTDFSDHETIFSDIESHCV